MASLTPFKAFNVIRFGVNGARPWRRSRASTRSSAGPWPSTSSRFGSLPATTLPPRVSLDELANRSDGELAKSAGAAKWPACDASCPSSTRRRCSRPHAHACEKRHGSPNAANAQRAESIVLDAYLTDIEPIEPWLRARDAELVTQLESSFTTTRAALQQRDPAAPRGSRPACWRCSIAPPARTRSRRRPPSSASPCWSSSARASRRP